ncbi:peptide-methionine (S)-S-oxide reductase MsrA [Undibacterium sp. TS12]|uniref:peptide-methionine (S)-S-oxide reductase MsrA n=1 Tax=Undibacterium sp. TS12 TaxID=2908202 RepID=UPI001F4CD47F|nr:peptide-methionine (S)-S-oxide reductase MsrA [Undibacterium sp. TS12]MCH8619460.1 peptide-methionine (S)-S-oxide reductase MsrA [Undibacterium sp. TS12]
MISSLLACSPVSSAQSSFVVPAPFSDEKPASTGRSETLLLAGGCFWGVQGVFQHVRGVSDAVSGYAGGNRDTAHYDKVGSGRTGHAETVQITYDPSQVSYGKLLQIFFSVAHDPTELNRQGPDTGTQYRSAIFPMNEMQRKIAQDYVDQLNQGKTFHHPVVTTIETFKGFYPAENYHQNFLTLHPDHGYIVVNDLPKVEALKRLFPAMYNTEPVLVRLASAK